ncbi:NADPH-dependent FMN reductase [Azoarcus indigens]|uniref:SsuE family FMN reductase n=1 Tax=Azoarcus indigens TaxID=29545 RepID=A0A4R6DRV4_9RHOO|nr:NADPH-dependent FMN reductase [Azoarcus indigens]NMG65853.1 NADPH-dependent FMN reductase [Azoarcus indigens]TDN47703.1 SsuE family FMN reductase [Azoarcus indigens]
MSILTLAGSPAASSRSRALLEWIGARLGRSGERVDSLAVRDLPAEDLLFARADTQALQAALAKVERAQALVISTPVYKAAYSGALKTFLDLLPQKGLAGKVVLPVVTGGSVAHTLAVEYALKPVLAALDARVVLNGVFIADSQLEYTPDGLRIAGEAESRLHEALDRFEDAALRFRWPLAGPRSAVAVESAFPLPVSG